MQSNFGERTHVVPVLASVDLGSSTTGTDVINAGVNHWIQFIVDVGAITGNAKVYVEECDNVTPSTPTATAKWSYRLTSAVGTDSVGDITAGSASGITLTDGTDENKTMIIDVDPAALTAGFPYVRLNIDPGSVLLVGVTALCYPRYPQNAQISAVV